MRMAGVKGGQVSPRVAVDVNIIPDTPIDIFSEDYRLYLYISYLWRI